MPVLVKETVLFSMAAAECIISRGNIAPGILRHPTDPAGHGTTPASQGGVDVDVQALLAAGKHGICHGLTMAWIIGFLCEPDGDASNTQTFELYFNVLRFQGAYFQTDARAKGMKMAMYLNPKRFFEAYSDAGLATGIKFLGGKITLTLRRADLPDAPVWAAHIGFPTHAFGIGYSNGNYYIMDPNCGLFTFPSSIHLTLELQKMYVAYVVKANRSDPISAVFYGI